VSEWPAFARPLAFCGLDVHTEGLGQLSKEAVRPRFLRAIAGAMPARIRIATIGLVLGVLCFACNETPADLRQWRPTDHDHTANPNAEQVQVTDAGSSEPGHGLDDVTIVAWQQNCTSCHGALGHGDGPQGPMLHAADLSRPDWQAATTDDAIAATIRQGRGKMPAFPLPDATIARLVQLIRMLDANRMQHAMNAAAQSSAAAAHSTAPPPASASAPKQVGR